MPVRWDNSAVLQISAAFSQSVTEIALAIEGQAKVNITRNGQVDTGFMRSAVYVDAQGADTYPGAIDDRLAPKIQAPSGGAVVAAGASYSYFQETTQSFLYRAVEQVSGGIAESIIRSNEV